jgi:ribosomal protein S18 acetylase RimI-like enzyme
MINVFVREAEESDLPALESLTNELIHSLWDSAGIDGRRAMENCNNLLHDPHFYFFVAQVNETLVGFVLFSLRKTLLHHGLSGVITELVVTEKYRGKGIGKQLIFTAIKHCTKVGCCEVEVSTEQSNRGARELYKRCGFEERGILFEMDL